MQQDLLEVKRERFSLKDRNQYILQGIWPEDGEPEVWLDKEKLEVKLEEWLDIGSEYRTINLDKRQGKCVTLNVQLPFYIMKKSYLSIYALSKGNRILWFKISARELEKKQKVPPYYLEEVVINNREHSCKIRGWVAYPRPVEIRIEDLNGNPVNNCEIHRMSRTDVKEIFCESQIEEKAGFYIEIRGVKTSKLILKFVAPDNQNSKIINMSPISVLMENITIYTKKGIHYAKTKGIPALSSKAFHKLVRERKPIVYEKWLRNHLPNNKELERQSKEIFKLKPKFSIVVPLYRTPEKYLKELVESVQKQTYGEWELCLSDGSGLESPLDEILQSLQKADNRIKVITHEEKLRISENTNEAIRIATGEYLVFADHDDILTPNALYECAKAINNNPLIEILYSDEDKMSMDGNQYFQPHMKPDFNLDLLCTVNYICHLFVVRKSIIETAGLLRPEYDGAQDYDFAFRCIESSKVIYHVPKILYHWRSHENSTSENPESKLYAFDAGQRAIEAHYKRIGISARVEKGEYLGLYRTHFIRSYDPLVSIIIPNKDHKEDLQRCINKIEACSTYKNYEYIIVENNSEDKETFDYYKSLEKSNPKVRIIYYKGEFNYSAINNYGAKFANGEYYLLLNNDTEIINDDCLEEMLGYCMRSDVGAVGARLYYEDETIQHAGVVIGFGGIAGHCFVQQKRKATGYCHRIICAQNYSAVTAACMMVKRSVFEDVGGLTEDLAVAFNDIDLCMKIRKAGFLIVYNPYAELYHYESKSRGLEDTPEKVARFNKEISIFEKRWPEILKNGDPYYNPNLTLESQDFSLKRNY